MFVRDRVDDCFMYLHGRSASSHRRDAAVDHHLEMAGPLPALAHDLGVPVVVGVRALVLEPEQLQRDARPAQFTVHVAPVQQLVVTGGTGAGRRQAGSDRSACRLGDLTLASLVPAPLLTAH
jgi:hypothetical protein